ncbi:MAG: dihydrolipoyl dehydrogenase [Bacteroidetes bacterium]|nr:dihydrolipoyl dehydrogenase [Bacteroidota bacterium]
MKLKNFFKVIILLIFVIGFVLFFKYDLQEKLTLNNIKESQQSFKDYYNNNPLQTIGIYTTIYVVSTALSLPGAVILTLLGGALFGLVTGTIIISFASTLGATLAFLAARFILKDYVQTRFKNQLKTINEGVKKEGAFYLFTLRLIPLFPFFLINLVMGLTPIKTFTYFWISQLGMFGGTIVYVFAGTRLAAIESLKDIAGPEIIVAFALLGIFPLIAKKTVDVIRVNKILGKFKKPKSFDFNMVVIGAGSAGLVAAYIASAIKAKVALIEKNKMGGDCLNTGCVPSKALIKSARFLSMTRKAQELGIESNTVNFDFAAVMERIQKVIQTVAPHDSVERYTGLGVDCINGAAEIMDPYRIKVEDKVITTRNIIVATGAAPLVPPFKGLELTDYKTSDTIWNLRKLPEKMIVLGGGPIGCELAQCFARFGAKVSIVEMGPQLLIREDDEVIEFVEKSFTEDGIEILTNHKAKEFRVENGQKILICETNDKEIKIPFDEILIALGRKANTKGFGLENLGVEIEKTGTVKVDPFLRSNYPNIFACGDVAGPYQFTHTAGHQAWYASVNALFSGIKKFKVDYRVIPWCTFTDPEIARVGFNEKEAKQQDIAYEVTEYQLSDLDRAIADSEAEGIVKVLTIPGKDGILGVTIAGAHAGELIAEFVLAMRYKLGLNKILSTIHIYPTWSEANKYVAGNWKKAHAPQKLLGYVERFHRWRRS